MIGEQTVACLGGTFNRIHAGHQLLFAAAFEVADLVRVGVTSDALVARLRGDRARLVRPFEQRKDAVLRLLRPYGEERFTVAALEDPMAPVERPEFDAIIVSHDTLQTAISINEQRVARGARALKVVVVPLLMAYDGKPISASRILGGEIDESGKRVAKGKRAPAGARGPGKGASGTKASKKRAPARSSARKGSRATGPRSRR